MVLNSLSSYPRTFFLPWARTVKTRCARTTQHVRLPHNSLYVIKSATTGPGTTTAVAKFVPSCMSASFANDLTTRPRIAPNASSTSPLAARTPHPSLADYLHRRPLPHQPSILLRPTHLNAPSSARHLTILVPRNFRLSPTS